MLQSTYRGEMHPQSQPLTINFCSQIFKENGTNESGNFESLLYEKIKFKHFVAPCLQWGVFETRFFKVYAPSSTTIRSSQII